MRTPQQMYSDSCSHPASAESKEQCEAALSEGFCPICKVQLVSWNCGPMCGCFKCPCCGNSRGFLLHAYPRK